MLITNHQDSAQKLLTEIKRWIILTFTKLNGFSSENRVHLLSAILRETGESAGRKDFSLPAIPELTRPEFIAAFILISSPLSDAFPTRIVSILLIENYIYRPRSLAANWLGKSNFVQDLGALQSVRPSL